MKLTALYLSLLLFSSFAYCQPAEITESQATTESLKVFLNLIDLSKSFNPEAANLYSENAKIDSKRTYPDGKQRKMELQGSQYIQLLKMAMPVAKQRNDISYFRNLTTQFNDGVVIIKCQRYSNIKDYSSPYEIHIKKVGETFKIVYEYTETKP